MPTDIAAREIEKSGRRIIELSEQVVRLWLMSEFTRGPMKPDYPLFRELSQEVQRYRNIGGFETHR